MESPIIAYISVVSICQVRPTRGRPPALVCICILLTTECAILFACTPALSVLARSVARFVIHALPRANLGPIYFQDKNQHHESTTDPKPHLQPSYGSSVQGCRSCRAPPDAMCRCHGEGVVAWLRRSGCMISDIYRCIHLAGQPLLVHRRSDRPAQRPLCKAQVYGPGIRR
jgi:hypothetical protein